MPGWISRLLLTAIVVGGAFNTVRLVSATADAVQRIGVTQEALSELTQYVTGTHAVNRERLALEVAPDGMTEFDASFDRRLGRLRALTAEMTASTSHVGGWAGGFVPESAGANGLRAIDAERRAYVQAVAAAATTEETPYRPGGVRLIDLHAQKLLAAITAQRDQTIAAKSGALIAAETNVSLALPAAALIVSYLIWRPSGSRSEGGGGA
jgi:hypothetical protein